MEIQILGLEKRINRRVDSFLRIPDIEQVRNLVVGFPWIRRRFPTQAHVQGEPRAHLEVILHIEGQHGLADALVAFLSDGHTAEKLRLRQDQVLNILERVLASRFRLNGVVILYAPDDAAPLEVVPALHVREVIAKFPEVVHPEPREVGVRPDIAYRGGSTLFTDG